MFLLSRRINNLDREVRWRNAGCADTPFGLIALRSSFVPSSEFRKRLPSARFFGWDPVFGVPSPRASRPGLSVRLHHFKICSTDYELIAGPIPFPRECCRSLPSQSFAPENRATAFLRRRGSKQAKKSSEAQGSARS